MAKRAFLLAVLLLTVSCTADEAEPAPDALSMELASSGGTAGGEIPITVTLINGTDEPLVLVRPTYTPNFVTFWVEAVDGEVMPFFGPHRQLRPLGDDGFVTLGPGESTSEQIDLGPGYRLDAGTYVIWAEYRNPAGGSHEGTRAIVFETGEGPVAAPIQVVVAP